MGRADTVAPVRFVGSLCFHCNGKRGEREEGGREEEYVFILQLSGGLWWDGRQQSIRPTDRPTTEGGTGAGAAVLFRSPPIKEVLKNNHTRGAAAVGAGAGRSSNSAF